MYTCKLNKSLHGEVTHLKMQLNLTSKTYITMSLYMEVTYVWLYPITVCEVLKEIAIISILKSNGQAVSLGAGTKILKIKLPMKIISSLDAVSMGLLQFNPTRIPPDNHFIETRPTRLITSFIKWHIHTTNVHFEHQTP